MEKITFLNFIALKYFRVFIIFHLATWFAVGLNIPILRQFFGFFFLSFVPGLVILRALHISKKSLTEIVLFSVGLSLVVVMFIGLLLNWVLPLMGLSAPLNTFNLVIAVTILEFILLVAGRQNLSQGLLFIKPKFVFSKSLLLIFSIPVFGILGAVVVDYYGNNLLMMFTFFMICVVFLLAAFGKISPKLYPLVIFSIAITLLFQTSLANHYLNGWDIHIEYYVAQVTQKAQYWDYSLMSAASLGINNYNTMLSITILPTIYSNVLNLNLFYVYTVIYPLLFGLVPIALFQIFKKQIGSRFAFWSVFLLLSFAGFYQMAYLARQMIAELFFVLIFLLLLEHEKKRIPVSIQIMLIVFAFGSVVSHYSTAFICLYYLFFFSLVLIRTSKSVSRILYLSVFAGITFLWYFFVSFSTPIDSIVGLFNYILNGFQDFFAFGSSYQVLSFAAGTLSTASFVNSISRFLFILVTAIIAIGVLKAFFTPKGLNFSKGFFSLSVAGALFIVASVVLPNFAAGLTILRTYQFGLLFTAPFLIFGSEFIFQIANKLKRLVPKISWTILPRTSVKLGSILISILLVTFFLFQIGVVTNLAGGVPSYLPLTTDKEQFVQSGNVSPFNAFTFAEDVYGARWLSNQINSTSMIYSDSISAIQVLLSYGLVYPANIVVPSNSTVLSGQSFIYLRDLNVVHGLFQDYDSINNMTEYSNFFENTNLVYSNGPCEIFYVP